MVASPAPLVGRTALVVASSEIGAAVAVALERAGARTGAALSAGLATPDGSRPANGGPLAAPDSAAEVAAAVEQLVAKLGAPDILVVDLLPTAVPALLDQTASAAISQALARVAATAAAMRAAFGGLKAGGRGRIILIGHRYGVSVAEGIAPYNSAAWALVGLMRSAALDWGRHAIATNLLMPAAATTEFREAQAAKPQVLDLLVSQLPLKRMGDPIADIGGAAVMLAGDAASFINGQIVHADGGQHIAGPVLNPAKLVASVPA